MINEGLQRYQDKLKAGEVERVALDPLDKAKANPKSLRLAINAKCYDCTCFQKAEVKKCVVKEK